MKRLLLILGLIFSAFAPLASQIKDYIFIVRPVYSQEFQSYLASTSDALRINGYSDAANLVSHLGENSFGSGFLHVASDGRNLLITNKHVVQDASEVRLEREREDGSMVVYENCPVIYIDDELDLALIAFPAGQQPYKTGLAFSLTAPRDGDEVWTAGYPALSEDPVWQFGKGNITNATLRLQELINPDRTALIQHSAQIDAGNSGGPLLVERKGTPSGYAVAGINTWKARFRQATNIAIPSTILQEFIDEAMIARTPGTEAKRLDSRFDELLKAYAETGDDEMECITKISRFVSLSYLMRVKEKHFVHVFNTAPRTTRDYLISAFLSSPLEGMRFATAWHIYQDLKKYLDGASITRPSASGWEIDGKTQSLELREKDIALSFQWTDEYGAWRLKLLETPTGSASGDTIKTKLDENPNRLRIEMPYSLLLFGQGEIRSTSETAIFLALSIKANDFIGFGFKAGGSIVPDYDSFSGQSGECLMMDVLAFGRLQLPFSSGKFSLIPFMDIGGGLQLIGSLESDYPSGPIGYLASGAQIVIDADVKYALGVSYGWAKSLPANVADIGVVTNFSIYLGFGG
jgi:serine protease Do